MFNLSTFDITIQKNIQKHLTCILENICFRGFKLELVQAPVKEIYIFFKSDLKQAFHIYKFICTQYLHRHFKRPNWREKLKVWLKIELTKVLLWIWPFSKTFIIYYELILMSKHSIMGMTYCIKYTILFKDCLVMKKICNWPITEADTDFSKLQKMSSFLHSWTLFFIASSGRDP